MEGALAGTSRRALDQAESPVGNTPNLNDALKKKNGEPGSSPFSLVRMPPLNAEGIYDGAHRKSGV
jgi:hypothetical protein